MARIDHLVTSGTFSLDGGTWDVDNNVWIVGDDTEVVVFDPAHNPQAIVDTVAGRRVVAILLTHAHDDHIRAVDETRRALAADGSTPPVYLNPDDEVLWAMVYPDVIPDVGVIDGLTVDVGGVTLRAIHTPGHSPGSTCWFAADGLEWDGAARPVLFSGDTLFNGGPGATGRSYSSFDTIIDSITKRLFPLPDDTVVLTGHGDTTSIGAEKPHLQEWLDRGH